MKVSLITKDEIKKLRSMTDNTEYEELVYKLHSSYNAVRVYANNLKDSNDSMLRCTKRKHRFERQAKK